MNGLLNAPKRYVDGFRVVLWRRGTWEPVTRPVPTMPFHDLWEFQSLFPEERYDIQRTMLLLN